MVGVAIYLVLYICFVALHVFARINEIKVQIRICFPQRIKKKLELRHLETMLAVSHFVIVNCGRPKPGSEATRHAR